MSKFTFAQRQEGFDNHIEKSIRGYSNLTSDIIDISNYFVEDDSIVVDIGCSTGKLMKQMLDKNKHAKNVSYIGVEVESDFYEHFDEDNLLEYSNNCRLEYFKGDVRQYEFPKNSSLVTSIFTLQFMPEKDRKQIIKNIYDSLRFGGAFIFAEKTLSNSAKIHEIRTFTYYDKKRKNFDCDDILDKEAQLRHMLKPTTREYLIDACRDAGFDLVDIDSFWQNYAFTGFIAIKK